MSSNDFTVQLCLVKQSGNKPSQGLLNYGNMNKVFEQK